MCKLQPCVVISAVHLVPPCFSSSGVQFRFFFESHKKPDERLGKRRCPLVPVHIVTSLGRPAVATSEAAHLGTMRLDEVVCGYANKRGRDPDDHQDRHANSPSGVYRTIVTP